MDSMPPPSLFTIQANSLFHRLQRGLSAVELIHIPHERWPNRHPRIRPSVRPLRISVLDSSFNPPTLAHLALANSTLPRYSHASASSVTCQSASPISGGVEYSDYDAKLLLLSVRNADKSLKPTDATYLQRLEMMILLARDIVHHGEKHPSSNMEQAANVAVAIINEPTFVGKSRALLSFLRQRLADLPPPTSEAYIASTPPSVSPQLTFLQGFDTLERFFSPRYYMSEIAMRQSFHSFFSPEGDDSRVVCARRVSSSVGSEQHESENEVLIMAKEFIEPGRIVLIDIGEDERRFSSSEVRDKIVEGDEGWRRLVSDNIVDYILQRKLYIPSLNT